MPDLTASASYFLAATAADSDAEVAEVAEVAEETYRALADLRPYHLRMLWTRLTSGRWHEDDPVRTKRKLAAARKAERQRMNIHALAHSDPHPEYRIDRAQDTPTTVKPAADDGIKIIHGKTHIALDPSETAELIRVAKRLTRLGHPNN